MDKRNDTRTQDGKDPFNPTSFSLSDFKKWMENQQQETPLKKELVGSEVEPKESVGLRKLIAKMESDEGEVHEMAKDFRRHGGVINEVDGTNLLIEVKSGTFVIARQYVRRRD